MNAMRGISKCENFPKRTELVWILYGQPIWQQQFSITIVISNNWERGPARDPVQKILEQTLFDSSIFYMAMMNLKKHVTNHNVIKIKERYHNDTTLLIATRVIWKPWDAYQNVKTFQKERNWYEYCTANIFGSSNNWERGPARDPVQKY